MTILNIASTSTLNKVKKELLEAKLLEQEKRGLNKANRLYLLNPDVSMSDIYEIKHQENNLISELEDKEFGSTTEERTEEASTLDNKGHSIIERPFSESGRSKNERQDVRKSNTNDTDLNETKDFKDNKDTKERSLPNDLNSLLKEKNKDTDPILIDQYIQQQDLNQKYGENILNVLKNYSKGDFDLFNQFIQTLDYAIKSAEKETGNSIELDLIENSAYVEALKEDLTYTIYNVLLKVRTDKHQKIKDPKAYFAYNYSKFFPQDYYIEINRNTNPIIYNSNGEKVNNNNNYELLLEKEDGSNLYQVTEKSNVDLMIEKNNVNVMNTIINLPENVIGLDKDMESDSINSFVNENNDTKTSEIYLDALQKKIVDKYSDLPQIIIPLNYQSL